MYNNSSHKIFRNLKLTSHYYSCVYLIHVCSFHCVYMLLYSKQSLTQSLTKSRQLILSQNPVSVWFTRYY